MQCPDGLTTEATASEQRGNCVTDRAAKQSGLTTGTLSVIGKSFQLLVFCL